MMLNPFQISIIGSAILATGLTIAPLTTGTNFAQTAAIAQSTPQNNAAPTFPDTQNNWAQPFIAALAQRDIVTGYPDGEYQPNRPVERDEFAAVIRKAFNQNRERQLSSGSVYRDVPDGYWAESAIEEAYEMGFMRGYPDNTFRPRQAVSRAEVLTSLARNLELEQRVPTTPQAADPAQPTQQAQAQSTSPQQARRRSSLMLPIAATSLLQPLVNLPAAVAAPAQNGASQPAAPQQPTAQQPQRLAQSATAKQPPREIVQEYYTDAAQIPDYAIDAIAATTKAGVVVNHPNLRTLNPNQPATRADVAAFIHQALVNKRQLPPLANNVAASQYIVGRDQINAAR
jgi:hypothetical protein